jgi:hypothetical protein
MHRQARLFGNSLCDRHGATTSLPTFTRFFVTLVDFRTAAYTYSIGSPLK